MPEINEQMKQFDEDNTREIKEIISFVFKQNLQRNVKIKSLQLVYIDQYSKQHECPMMATPELFAEIMDKDEQLKEDIIEEYKGQMDPAPRYDPRVENVDINGLKGPDHPDNKKGILVKLRESIKKI